MSDPGRGRRVVAVTGGGGGIGAAIAEELGRRGDHVVTMDPLVTLDGAATLPAPEETTAGRITAAGGSARATSVSVTDGGAVRALFDELVAEHGRLDAVINVAGITRPTSFARGSEDDWRDVVAVHLAGYLNVLRAALPLMAKAGHGRILGVTSGSGWRPADAGAYSAAKRAVAALTWQVGRVTPPGVTVNAISPIAVTRMVTAALERARAASGKTGSGAATGGLSLGSMPEPAELGPLGAHLVGDDAGWCRGQVVFAGGSEVALVEPPRLLEVARTAGVDDLAGLLEVVSARAFVAAEAAQATTGAANPRFADVYRDAPPAAPAGTRACAVVTDEPALGAVLAGALERRGVTVHAVDGGQVAGVTAASSRFEAAAAALGSVDAPVDAVVVALSGTTPGGAAGERWAQVLAEHDGIEDGICLDAAWARAVADRAAAGSAPVRLVTLVDATTAGGRSRAQAAAQLARSARSATGDRVSAVAVSVESAGGATGELAAHLVAAPDAGELSGAELAAGDGWVALRSHPRPAGSIVMGGAELPPWFDDALRELAGVGEEDAG